MAYKVKNRFDPRGSIAREIDESRCGADDELRVDPLLDSFAVTYSTMCREHARLRDLTEWQCAFHWLELRKATEADKPWVSIGERAFGRLDNESAFNEEFSFANLKVCASNVMLSSCTPAMLSLALINMFPIVAGHTIIIPRRRVEGIAGLTDEEFLDIWLTVRKTQRSLQRHHCSAAFNIEVPDGAGAGQPVPHLHVHLVPRTQGDGLGNDQVYRLLDDWCPELGIGDSNKAAIDTCDTCQTLDFEEMASQATMYRTADIAISEQAYRFSDLDVPTASIFYLSPSGLTMAFVHWTPLVSGHVLVIPRREAPSLADLTDAEFEDLFRSVREVQAIVCHKCGVRASRLRIQDGKEAGQSVPHVHVHILPQKYSASTVQS